MTENSIVLDPVAFADRVANFVGCALDNYVTTLGLAEIVAAPQREEFERREADLVAAHPEINPPGINPFSRLQEAALAWAQASYDAGVRHGAAIEAMRRALVAESGR